MGRCSQHCVFDDDLGRIGGGDDSRSGWAGGIPVGIRPRLNFNSQASQDSGYSTETAVADASRDGFDLFGGQDLSIITPAESIDKSGRQRGEGTHLKERIESMSMSVAGSSAALLPQASNKLPGVAQNPFLPPMVRKASLFGATLTPTDKSTFGMKFEREFTIGSGAFAEVCVARSRLEGTIYAVKRVRAVITGERMHNRILNEVYVLSVLRGCPRIIQYFDSWVESSHLHICTELCLKETLMSFLTYGKLFSIGTKFFDYSLSEVPNMTPRFSTNSYDEYELSQQVGQVASQRRPRPLHRNLSTTSNGGAPVEIPPPGGYCISEELAWVIIESVAAALDYMHGNGIAHLDVKPGNILIAASSYFELESLYSRLRSVTEYSREHYDHLAELEPKLVSGLWKLKLGVEHVLAI